VLTRNKIACKRWMRTENLKKNIVKTAIFVLFTSLPFVSITNTIGIETFLDSFENPDKYIIIKNSPDYLTSDIEQQKYIIIQKSTHPKFNVEKEDEIIHIKTDGTLTCNKIYKINGIGYFEKYYILENDKPSSYPVYKTQIVGKIIKTLDDNLWNQISIKTWETSIKNLNIHALVSD
jgi:hypothetical protein